MIFDILSRGGGAGGTGTSYLKIYTEVPLEYRYHSAKPVW
jgi:hypothetical protein